MTNIKEDIRKRVFENKDRFFIDTNVWLSVWGPLAHLRHRASTYSAAYRDIRKANSCIYVSLGVLSEFVYRYIRLEQEQAGVGNIALKNFRSYPIFQDIAAAVKLAVDGIMKNAIKLGCGFSNADLPFILSSFESARADFNDLIIEDLCRRNGLVLITDDGDFGASDLEILSANPNLLS